jgi:hypothetical protein
MSISTNPVCSLPNRPSEEFLHKEAKRFAREHDLQLAAGLHQIAHEYGYRNWPELMTAVEMMAAPDQQAGSGSSSQAPEARDVRQTPENPSSRASLVESADFSLRAKCLGQLRPSQNGSLVLEGR